jgi:hypothetical protein
VGDDPRFLCHNSNASSFFIYALLISLFSIFIPQQADNWPQDLDTHASNTTYHFEEYNATGHSSVSNTSLCSGIIERKEKKKGEKER